MDFSQLLNTSTDFDKNKLSLLEQVISILYATNTNPQDVRNNKYLIYFLFYSVNQPINY